MSRHQKIIYLFFGIAVIGIYIILTLTILRDSSDDQETIRISPTAAPSPQPTSHAVFENVEVKQLPLQEQQVRLRLINRADKTTGLIYAEDSFQIIYLTSHNLFQARITTEEIDNSKQAVVSWFGGQGIQESSLCSLPMVFYANPRLLEQTNQADSFDPLPDGCT